MHARTGKLVSGGRLLVPAEMRRQLGLADGMAVVMRVVDGELHVRPLHEAVVRVQARLPDACVSAACRMRPSTRASTIWT